MTGYCFDTDVISATIWPSPPMHLIRRLAVLPPRDQYTTAITVAELLYGAYRVGRHALTARVEQVVRSAQTVLPFDASIALSHGLVLVTRNVRHFARVPGLVVENWIDRNPEVVSEV